MPFWRAWPPGRRFSVLALVVIGTWSSTLLTWGFWPVDLNTEILRLGGNQGTPVATGADGAGEGNRPATALLPLTSEITLQYPPQIRVGDAALVRMRLGRPQDGSVSAGVGIPSELPAGEGAPIASTPPAQGVIAEARLDLPGARLRPFEAIGEPLVHDHPVEYVWSVVLTEPGVYQGTAWLATVMVDEPTAPGDRTILSAQSLQLRGTQLLGMNGSAARLAGGLGLLVCAIVVLASSTHRVRRKT